MVQSVSQGGQHGGGCSADQAWTNWAGWRAMQGLSPEDCCEDVAAAETSNCLQVRTGNDSPPMLLIVLHISSLHTLTHSCLSALDIHSSHTCAIRERHNSSLVPKISKAAELAERQCSHLCSMLYSINGTSWAKREESRASKARGSWALEFRAWLSGLLHHTEPDFKLFYLLLRPSSFFFQFWMLLKTNQARPNYIRLHENPRRLSDSQKQKAWTMPS